MGNQELVELISTVIKREISPINVHLDSLEKATKITNDRLNSLEKATNDRLDSMEKTTNDRLDSMEKTTNNRLDLMEKTTNNRLDSMEKTTNNRLGVLEVKADMTHRKIGNLEFAMKSMERDIKKDIRMLYDAQETLIVVLEGKGILPQVRG